MLCVRNNKILEKRKLFRHGFDTIVCCSVLQCVAVCCCVWRSSAGCCSAPTPPKNEETTSWLNCFDQHTATHCNTLQHTATHCNTLQHAATRCNTLQHTATHCNTLQRIATHYNTLQHTATRVACVLPTPYLSGHTDTQTHRHKDTQTNRHIFD